MSLAKIASEMAAYWDAKKASEILRRQADQQSKLAYIARCSADELRGYVWGVGKIGREYFPGERAALMQRAKELGVRL